METSYPWLRLGDLLSTSLFEKVIISPSIFRSLYFCLYFVYNSHNFISKLPITALGSFVLFFMFRSSLSFLISM